VIYTGNGSGNRARQFRMKTDMKKTYEKKTKKIFKLYVKM
jgi:hypothetical protein